MQQKMLLGPACATDTTTMSQHFVYRRYIAEKMYSRSEMISLEYRLWSVIPILCPMQVNMEQDMAPETLTTRSGVLFCLGRDGKLRKDPQRPKYWSVL